MRTNIFSVGLVATMLVLSTASASAQSTNQSSPTALSMSEYSGKGPSKETNYFFSFTGGPGEVTVKLEIKAKSYSTFARIELLDKELNALAMHNMNASTTSGAQQVLKTISLADKQNVLVKVTLDGNLADYKITLGGAVETVGAATETTGSAGIPESSNSSVDTSQAETAGPTMASTTGTNKFFNIDLGKFKIGQFINFPKTGTLVIQMKDGTTQEVDLANVKSVTVKK